MLITSPIDRGALTRREEDAQLRLDFATFAQRCFHELNPLTRFAMNWHVEVITAELAAVYQGQIRRLVVNVPPRYLKSHLGSVTFPAWCHERQPGTQILCVSYAQDLADKLAPDCRRIMMSDWYQRAFPTRLSVQRQAVPEFETTQQRCRLATSVGGMLTGRGADIIVIDDPSKPEEALSQTQRRRRTNGSTTPSTAASTTGAEQSVSSCRNLVRNVPFSVKGYQMPARSPDSAAPPRAGV